MMNYEAICRAYPNTGWADDGEGVFDVDGNRIEIDQALVDAAAIEVATERAWSDLRSKRNELLSETDYLALSDGSLTDEMRTYRQSLRDLPSNTTDPTNPTWPTKP
tara:strand:+ start:567 stop:884 length:318 start_codon:yes stop_codon:yes gene_type:complete